MKHWLLFAATAICRSEYSVGRGGEPVITDDRRLA
jgi:hypothetical protein